MFGLKFSLRIVCLFCVVSGILMDTDVYFCSTNELICSKEVQGSHECNLPSRHMGGFSFPHRECGLPPHGGTVKFEFGDGKTTCKDGGYTKYCGHNKKYLPRHFLVVGDEGRANGYRLEPEFSKLVCGNCNIGNQYRAERIKFRYGGNLTFTVNEDTGSCERKLEILVMPSSGYWGGPSHCSE